MTKSSQKGVVTPKNNIPSYDEICLKMSQSTFRDAKRAQEINELIDALQKIGYFQSFRVKENYTFSSEKTQKAPERKLKTRRKAAYRRIRKYYKSAKQYQKERLRRKLCWLLSGKFKESEIAEMLGISRRTVIRDMNKIKPYYFRMSSNYFSKLEQERIKELNLKLEGKTLRQQFDILLKERERKMDLLKLRDYHRHHTIITLDMTQPGPYGIPKLSISGKGKTLAYPHAVRIHIITEHEGRKFEAEIGGYNITQTTVNRGWF